MSRFVPPQHVSLAEITQSSVEVLARPNRSIAQFEDILRIESMGLEWDVGFMVYEPVDGQIATDPQGRKIGIFLLHGGSADYRDVEPLARMLAEKFGFKVLSGTFPGRLYLPDETRRWPGDTISVDGSVRTPIWLRGEVIGSDQYTVVRDDSMRNRYGVRTLARAVPGSLFHARMAAWPVAFEEAMVAGNRKHLPAGEYVIFGEGHSTGGPFICMLSQRIENMEGVIATEHSPFGEFCSKRDAEKGISGTIPGYDIPIDENRSRTDAFDELYIRTWRDEARYLGPEALGSEGPQALMRLPSLIEEVLDEWDQVKHYPQFKAEYIVTQAIHGSLEAAAGVTAQRLQMDEGQTRALVERYKDYSRPVEAHTARAVPPFLYSIAKYSRDHHPDVYNEFYLPSFSEISPAPTVSLVQFGAGTHTFWKKISDELPLGIAPAVAVLWERAIAGGYFIRA